MIPTSSRLCGGGKGGRGGCISGYAARIQQELNQRLKLVLSSSRGWQMLPVLFVAAKLTSVGFGSRDYRWDGRARDPPPPLYARRGSASSTPFQTSFRLGLGWVRRFHSLHTLPPSSDRPSISCSFQDPRRGPSGIPDLLKDWRITSHTHFCPIHNLSGGNPQKLFGPGITTLDSRKISLFRPERDHTGSSRSPPPPVSTEQVAWDYTVREKKGGPCFQRLNIEALMTLCFRFLVCKPRAPRPRSYSRGVLNVHRLTGLQLPKRKKTVGGDQGSIRTSIQLNASLIHLSSYAYRGPERELARPKPSTTNNNQGSAFQQLSLIE